MRGPPVVLTNTLGRPVTNVISERGAVPMVVVDALGEPVTLVNSGGEPVTLFNPSGTLWDYPFSLFANNEQGAWYDPSDFSTLRQDSTGTTPVTAVEQPVGLMLDRSRGLVLGAELVTNGSFDANITGWTNASTGTGTATWSAGGASLVRIDAGNSGILRQSFTTVAGQSYRISYSAASAAIKGGVGTSALDDSLSNTSATAGTTTTAIFVASGTTTHVYFIPVTNSTTAVLDDVTIKSLPGNHAIQATSASRPVLRARYNQLTFSEQFDNAAWTKLNTTITANAAVAPDGTTTADKLIENSATDFHTVRPTTSVGTIGATETLSVHAKAAERSWFALQLGSNRTAYFNVSTGTIGTTSAGTTATITALANGWYRCTIAGERVATQGNQIILASGDNVPSYTGDGTSGILIWGEQLLTAADNTSTGGAYQRIAAATDYDTTNPVWRPYLAFDGTDDSFGTSAIDFSATDEMTVFAGVTKLSDAARGILVELSATAGTNAGSFFVDAPSGTTDYGAGLFEGTPLRRASTYAAPITNALTVLLDIAGATEADEIQIRANGAAASMTTVNSGTETGNFGNYPMFIGRRNNASFPLSGRLYSLAVLGRTATAAELSAMEAWVNGKTGAF